MLEILDLEEAIEAERDKILQGKFNITLISFFNLIKS